MSRDDKVREILEELWDKAYGSKFVRDFYGIDKALSQLDSLYKIDANDIPIKIYGYTLHELKQIIDFAKSKDFEPNAERN